MWEVFAYVEEVKVKVLYGQQKHELSHSLLYVDDVFGCLYPATQ